MRVFNLLLIGILIALCARAESVGAHPPKDEPRPEPCETTTRPPCTTPRPPCTTTRPPCTTPRPPCTTTRPPCTTPRPPCTTTRPPCTTPRPPPCTTTQAPCTEETTTPCPTPAPTKAPSSSKNGNTGNNANTNTGNNENTGNEALVQMLISRHDCRGKDDGTYLANIRHCRQYYVCNRQRSRRQNCPQGQWFDRALKTCRQSSEVTNCLAMRN